MRLTDDLEIVGGRCWMRKVIKCKRVPHVVIKRFYDISAGNSSNDDKQVLRIPQLLHI